MSLFYPFYLILLVSFFLFFAGLILSLKTLQSKEKSSPYECGFDKISSGRGGFSVQFFVMAIIFIIFDVEISVILPFSVLKDWVDLWKINVFVLLIVLVLLGGLFYEWVSGGLKWLG